MSLLVMAEKYGLFSQVADAITKVKHYTQAEVAPVLQAFFEEGKAIASAQPLVSFVAKSSESAFTLLGDFFRSVAQAANPEFRRQPSVTQAYTAG